MYQILCFTVGIMIAQLAVPMGAVLVAYQNEMITFNDGVGMALHSTMAVGLTSLVGLVVSVPFSLIIGIPASYLLGRYGQLNLLGIFSASILTATVFVVFITGNQAVGLVVLLATAIGSIIYWFFLHSCGALTSTGKGRS